MFLHLSEEDYALYAVQFHLFVTCILFLSREGFRRACMSSDFSDDASEIGANAAKLLKVVWMSFPLGILVTLAACLFVFWWQDLIYSSPYAKAILINGFACIIELLAEPLYILSQNLGFLRLRSGSAPPTVEGSLSAVGGFFNSGGVGEGGGDVGSTFAEFARNTSGSGFSSEEELSILDLKCSPVEPIFVSATASMRQGTGYFDNLGFASLIVWNMRTWKPMTVLPLGNDPPAITSLSFNHNGKLLAAAATDVIIHMFVKEQAACIAELMAFMKSSGHKADKRPAESDSD